MFIVKNLGNEIYNIKVKSAKYLPAREIIVISTWLHLLTCFFLRMLNILQNSENTKYAVLYLIFYLALSY